MIKIWIDPVQPAPSGHIWCKSVKEAKDQIMVYESCFTKEYRQGVMNRDLLIEYIDIVLNDYEMAELVRWNTVTKREYPIKYHESTRRIRYYIGGFNRSAFTCDTWEEFVKYLKDEKDKFERCGAEVFEISIDNTPSSPADKVKLEDVPEDVIEARQYLEGIGGTKNPDDMIFG